MFDGPEGNRGEALESSEPAICKATSLGEGTENFYTGSEPFFTFFTQAQIIMGALRLTLENRVIVPSTDLGAQMEGARRGFQHTGVLKIAIQDVTRIASIYRQRVQLWEREIQNIEREKRSMNGAKIQQIKAEAAYIRGRIQAIDRAIVKLEVQLHQMVGEAIDEARLKAKGGN